MTLNLLKVHRLTMHTVPYSEAKGMVCAACAPTWYFEQSNGNGSWLNLKITVTGSRRKFSLGWDGQRLARSVELDTLVDRYPAVAEDVLAWAEALPMAVPQISRSSATTTRSVPA